MHFRTSLGAAALCLIVAAPPAHAQLASSPPPVESGAGWSFAVNPYIWLPRISQTLQATGPQGGTVSTTVEAGFTDYLTLVNFAAMVGGVARYDRFSVMTDLVYINDSLTSSTIHLSSVNPGSGPIDIPRSVQVGTGTRMAMTIWSLAGGYTLLQGGWGNLDALAGLRMVTFSSTTNYQLDTDIQAPDHTLALSRGGTLNIDKAYFDAIGGITGRINIPNSKFYLPFYFDAGTGGLPFTWQVYGGVARSVTNWADLSAGYRHLAFDNNPVTGVHHMSLSGFILGANIHF
jgi:hypothetical protein